MIGRVTRREVVGCALVAMLAATCKAERVGKASQALQPEDPVDEAFLGCQKSSCGTRTTSATVVLQPNAKLGDYTRCPVSGAAFQITEKTVQRVYRERPVFLCCESCARYFDQHADVVVASRHI